MLYKIYATSLLMIISLAMVSCNNKADALGENVSVEELSTLYRDRIHNEFMSKARQYGADTHFLILVDYSIPSNSDRLFIWDVEKDKIVEKFWCAHGFGRNSTAEKPEFSNVVGSNCSSLGWFLVDRSVGVSSNWGYKYHAVDGLDACNSNARRREILIHPWSSVTYDYNMQIKQPMVLDGRSAGCFTTTEDGFNTIDRYVKSQKKRMLLYAFNGVCNFL